MANPTPPPLVTYTVLRLGLFVAVLALVALLGARGWLLLVIAGVVSFALSYVLLRGPRERLALSVAQRLDPATRRPGRLARALGADADAEDGEAEKREAAEREAERRRASGPPQP